MTANTVTFTAADGYTQSFPLELLLERGALLADRVNGEPVSESFGGANRLIIPGLPARYHISDVVEVKFEQRDEVPELPPFEDDGHDFTNRPNVSAKCPQIGHAGETVRFEGYADDFDRDIVAIEFSLDEGKNWTRYATDGARAGRWIWWSFDWTPQIPGLYELRVRSVNAEGKASPVPAGGVLEVR